MNAKSRPQKRTAAKPAHARSGAERRSAPRQPVRTCIGCRKLGSSADLVRMVLSPEGGVAFDLAGGAMGRGAWVHPTLECLQKASKGAVRSLGADKTRSRGVEELMLALGRAASRRAQGLILAAHRAHHLCVGGEACQRAFSQGNARLVVLTGDAMAAGKHPWISEAITKGMLVVWSSKAELGAIVGREELAVMVVTEAGLARNLLRTIEMMTPVTSRLAKANHDAAAVVAAARTIGSQGRQDSEDG